MKFSTVKPIHKKGDRKNPANYRPISLLNSFSKVLEKALYNRLAEHFSTYSLLVGYQFGFRKGIATEDAILSLQMKYYMLSTLKNWLGVFCDLEKAFDSVNHATLLSKLPYYGINGKAKMLLDSYLQNRYQRIQIINSHLNTTTTSKWTKVRHGVPQGSILGPLLFLIYYINDLPRAVEHKAFPILFADDTSIILTSPNITQMQSDFNEIFMQLNKWFKLNSLSLNLDKTLFIQFTNKTTCISDIQIKYEDKQIRTVKEAKFLGLLINNNLSWKTHIECIKTKLSSACYAMRSIKPYVATNTLKMIYYSYFHSIMTYGLLFWGNCTDSQKIFRLQKKIIRIMMGKNYRVV